MLSKMLVLLGVASGFFVAPYQRPSAPAQAAPAGQVVGFMQPASPGLVMLPAEFATQPAGDDSAFSPALALCVGALAGAGLAGAVKPRLAAAAVGGQEAATKIDAKVVKQLRDATGAGMMDCKKALVEAEGNIEVATEALRKKGLASAEKKAGRAAQEGIIETYIHTGSKLGVMVEVNCETDFVAKRPEFKELARNIAMQVAASPTVEVVSEENISAEFLENEKRMESQAEDLKGKPEQIVEKIVAGRVAKILKTKTLMEQPYFRDPNQNIDELVKSNIAKLGENIKVARFIRFKMGETLAADDGEDAE